MAESTVVVEKSLRSVFVGNIPYEATDEKLRDIFSQVGPVLSFKLMYDRETGKPKGYGFCEYKDQETALSAMRNLNGYEISGRPLRVDNACTEKSRMEMQSLMMGPVVESPFGPEVDSDKAPEAISNAVASLPPEQMYELMRQMKLCVRNNPSEARTMLMNNPQLAYALLQAQVVMRIIDPKVAVQILHGSRDPIEPILPNTEEAPKNDSNSAGHGINGGPPPLPPSNAHSSGPTGPMLRPPNSHPPGGPGSFSGPPVGQPPMLPVPPPNRPTFPGAGNEFDMRQVGPPPRGPPMPNDMDMRMPPSMGHPPANPPGHDNFRPPPMDQGRFGRDYDQRGIRDGPPQMPRDRDSRDNYGRDNRERDRDIRPNRADARDLRDSRGMDRDKDYRSNPPGEGPRDPRSRNMTQNQDKDFRSLPQNPPPATTVPPPSGAGRGVPNAPNINIPQALAGQDQEKANLIMQVLQLSDEQIRMLPPEQQKSILQLKEQIQRSSH